VVLTIQRSPTSIFVNLSWATPNLPSSSRRDLECFLISFRYITAAVDLTAIL
jgi:hypothetical protein